MIATTLANRLTDSGASRSALGLGLAALGRPGYINLGHNQDLASGDSDQPYTVDAMQAQASVVLDEAWRRGIGYFDVARSYGQAEAFLGHWLRERDIVPEAVTVASKWGYTYTAGWQINAEQHEVKEHSLPVLQRQWSETQTTLGRYLDLYQIHSATMESGVLENAEVHAELSRLKQEGIAIGLTLSGPNQAQVLDQAMAVEVEGRPLFDAVQATWNLLESSASSALASASDKGLFVVVKEALANGRLTQRNDSRAFAVKLALLRQQAARLETTVDALALAGVLAQPWVDVVLSGAATVEHVASNVRAFDVAWDDEAATCLATLAEEPAYYWQTRSDLAWN